MKRYSNILAVFIGERKLYFAKFTPANCNFILASIISENIQSTKNPEKKFRYPSKNMSIAKILYKATLFWHIFIIIL